MVYFTEKLINEIRDRSCIWDTADVNHLNKDVLTTMWTEIAENLYSDWNDLSTFDRRDRIADVKKKWTNIKDSFVKDVKGKKPRKSRGPPEHKKKYYLFDHLQFLIPFIQDAKPGESKKRMRKFPTTAAGGEGPSRTHASASAGETTMTAASVKPETSQPDVQHHVDLLNNFAGKPVSEALCQLDGDLSFMVSLLPTIKTMNEMQKINFKIGVLQLLARIKFDEVLLQQNPEAFTGTGPFATADLRSYFPVPYQAGAIPFPFVSSHHHHQAAVSSTQQMQRMHHNSATASAARASLKAEAVDSATPPSSSFETDPEDDGHGDDFDN